MLIKCYKATSILCLMLYISCGYFVLIVKHDVFWNTPLQLSMKEPYYPWSYIFIFLAVIWRQGLSLSVGSASAFPVISLWLFLCFCRPWQFSSCKHLMEPLCFHWTLGDFFSFNFVLIETVSMGILYSFKYPNIFSYRAGLFLSSYFIMMIIL